MLIRFLIALALLLTGGCQCFDTKKNLVYNTGDPAWTFDYYEPTGPLDGGDQRPAIIAIHGGAWSSGDKSWGEQVAEEFCCKGYVVFSVNYRLAPAHVWPAQINDCQDALIYFRSTASTWGINPDKIGALGVSAGGHLAAMLALRGPARVQAAVCANGEGDLTLYGAEPIMANEDNILTDVLGPGFGLPELTDLSPVTFALGGNPVWVVHSTGDDNVFFAQGQHLHNALVGAGVDTGFSVVQDSCHGKCWKDAAPLQAARAFFAKHLGDRQ